MCSRYTLIAPLSDLQHRFSFDSGPIEFRPQDTILPSQGVLTVLRPGHDNQVRVMRWGLVPHWTNDPAKAMINARSETLSQKTSFKEAFTRRRCIIPATGFFERHRTPGHSIPTLISMNSAEPFAMAGLWQPWKTLDGRTIATCAIITTPPNDAVRPVHNRMPAILLPEHEDVWLDPELRDPSTLASLLNPHPDGLMTATPVIAVP